MTKRYVLWGSGGHARVLADIIAEQGDEVVALCDNLPGIESALPGVPVFTGREGLAALRQRISGPLLGLASIGGARGRDRLEIQQLFVDYGIEISPPLVHRSASVSRSAKLGVGTQVLAQSVVAAGAEVGRGCILNHRTGVDHETRLGDGVHLAPGSTLCGLVTLGDNVMIGAGATVGPRVRIGANTIVGAGAVVLQDLPSGVRAWGVPARVAQ